MYVYIYIYIYIYIYTYIHTYMYKAHAKSKPRASDEDGELDRRLNAVELTLLGVLVWAELGGILRPVDLGRFRVLGFRGGSGSLKCGV